MPIKKLEPGDRNYAQKINELCDHINGEEKETITIQDLITQLKFGFVNSNIPEKFSVETIRGEVVIKHFNKYITSENVISELKKEGLEPANLTELLMYARNDWNKKDLVVALGSSCVLVGSRYVPCLRGGSGGRRLRLHYFDFEWRGGYRFAAVRTSPLDAGKLGAFGHLAAEKDQKEEDDECEPFCHTPECVESINKELCDKDQKITQLENKLQMAGEALEDIASSNYPTQRVEIAKEALAKLK